MAKTAQYATKSMTGFWQTGKRGQMPVKHMTGVTGGVATMVKRGQTATKSMSSWPSGSMVKTAQYGVKSMAGLVGQIGSMSKTAQYGQTAKGGYFNIIGAMAKTGRMPFKSMTSGVATGANWIVVSMHTERQALTQYTNYQFNSFAIFNGKVLGASDAGLFELAGSTDNGSPINAAIEGGIDEFGTSFRKNIDYAFVGYRTDGDLLFSIYVYDNGTQYDYPLPAHSVATGIYGRRVVVGKGLRARYFQWKLANQNGADFHLDNVEMDVKQLVRRTGGSDA